MSGSTAHTAPVAAPARSPLPDSLLCAGLLIVLAARPLLGETFEPVPAAILTALDAPLGPTPATTAWLDLVLLTLSLAVLLRDGRWYRRLALAAGVIALAVAVGLSSVAAADKRQTWLVGSNLLIGVLAGCGLCTVPRAAWTRSLLVALLLATAGTTAVKCVLQRTIEQPQTKRQWEEVYKPELLRQGFDPANPFVINFERRLYAAESHGFLGHPNITGSCLALGVAVVTGLAGALWLERRRAFLLVVVVGVLFAVGLWTTDSKGALAAAAFGLAVALFLGLCADWCHRHVRLIFAGLVAAYMLLIGGIAALGLLRGTLPHPSLAFRWQYWTAALRAWCDTPLTGVGRGNFAAAYLLHKSAAATEEVRDPHNLWIALLVEVGPLGLCGAAVLVGTVAYRLLAALPGSAVGTKLSVPLAVAGPVAAGVLGLQLGLSGLPVHSLPVVLVWLQETAAPWLAALLLGLWLSRVLGTPRAWSWVAGGCAAAWLAALLHGVLDFALLTPGGLAFATLCIACGVSIGGEAVPISQTQLARAAAGSAPHGGGRVPRAWMSVLLALLATGAVGAHARYVVYPAAVRASLVREVEAAARVAITAGPGELVSLGRRLAERGAVDPVVDRLAAQELLRLARGGAQSPERRTELLTMARGLAERAASVAKQDCDSFVTLANICDELATGYEELGDPQAARRANQDAVRAWETAVALYPTNPRTRIAAGLAWLRFWRLTGETSQAHRAVHHLQQALWIDEQRPPADTMRLQDSELRRVKAALSELPVDARAGGRE